MTCLTEEEREECLYERWIIAGGPAKAKTEHEALALASLDALREAGYAVLSQEMKCQPFRDVEVVEAVVRKGDKLNLIIWQTFNRGWMTQSPGGGWVIFDPLAAPRTIDPAPAAVVF